MSSVWICQMNYQVRIPSVIPAPEASVSSDWLTAFYLFISGLPSTGGSLSVAGGKKAEPQAALADADADLEERLNNLRRD